MAKKQSIPAPRRPAQLEDVYRGIGEKNWRRGSAGIDEIEAVATPFLDYNWGSTIGGVPPKRVIVVHGASHNGKTAFCLSVARAFLHEGFMVGLVDAEHTMERDFAEALLGGDLDEFPNLFFPPEESLLTYEGVMAWTDDFMVQARQMREKNPWYKGSLIVYDSLDAMTPAQFVEDTLREMAGDAVKGGTDDEVTAMTKGNADQRKAMLNRTWINRLCTQAAYSSTTCLIITHEKEEEIKAGNRVLAKKKAPRGGRALELYSSFAVRVSRTGYIEEDVGGKEVSTGTKHEAQIRKNKMGFMEGRGTTTSFWIASGKGSSPMGIDFARDAVETGLARGVLQRLDKSGKESKQGSVTFDGLVLGRSINQAVAYLNDHAETLDLVREAVALREQETRAVRRGKRPDLAASDTMPASVGTGDDTTAAETPKRRRAAKKADVERGQS